MFNFNFMRLKLKKKGFECTNILFNAWNFLNIFTPSKIILLWNSWGLGRSPCSRPNCVRFIRLALAAPTIRSWAPPSTWHRSWWTLLAPTGTYRWRCFRMVMAPVVVVGFALITPRLTYTWKTNKLFKVISSQRGWLCFQLQPSRFLNSPVYPILPVCSGEY